MEQNTENKNYNNTDGKRTAKMSLHVCYNK